MSLRLQLEHLNSVSDQNQALICRVEDLEAQIKKSRDEKKKLILQNEQMQTSVHEAMTAKEKISMELDYLRYRLENTEESIDSPSSSSQGITT